MKRVLLAGLAAVALVGAGLAPAEASGGCGPYRHRDWHGFCRPNGYVVPYGFYGGGPGWGWHRGYGGPGWGWHRGWGGPGWHHWHRW